MSVMYIEQGHMGSIPSLQQNSAVLKC